MTSASPGAAAPHWIYRALYSVADGLILIDSTDHIVLWNACAESLLRWRADEMIGRHAEEMAARIAARSASSERVLEQLKTSLVSPEDETTVEFELLPAPESPPDRENPDALQNNPSARKIKLGPDTRNESPRFIQAHFFPVREAGGETVGLGILLRDITREREADAMKSQLLSTVSHELRTPLASIKGFASTLLRQDVTWDERTQRDFLRIIEEEADRLTEIIDNLLDMSQIEAGALRIEKSPTQLRTIIREVVNELRMHTEAHWFVVDLPNDLPSVNADPRRIRQVIHNLVENAIKYSTGGQITVRCEVEADDVIISISDQGEGIPAEYLNRVFDRFFQVNGGATRRVGGSGLGLSISRGIVLAHGGRIWAESTVSKGSTFRFTLPLATREDGE